MPFHCNTIFIFTKGSKLNCIKNVINTMKSSNGFELSTMYRIRPKHDQLKWQVVLRNVGFGLVIEKSVAFPKCVKIVHVFVELVASSRIYTWGVHGPYVFTSLNWTPTLEW